MGFKLVFLENTVITQVNDNYDFEASKLGGTIVIEINPEYANAYKNRSISKENIGDIQGSCVDPKKSVSLGDTASDNQTWIKKHC